MKNGKVIGKGLGIALVVCLMLGSMIGVAGSTERTDGESISGMGDQRNESIMSATDNKAGITDVSATTVAYPFFDDVESGVGAWVADPPWGLTDESCHSGNYSWTDSPGTSYGNSVNVALTLTIDLSMAIMPVLSFWHRYSLEKNADWGYVDVSTNEGSTWTTIYFVTGHHTEWKEEKIDLSPYAGDILTFRFRLQTDGENRYDGWYIDDVSIAETTASISYPFFDDMESGDANWYSSSWELVTPGHSGDYTFDDSPEGNGPPGVYAYTSLTLASTIDLSTAKNPQMSFWEHYDAFHCYVEASSNWGHTWTTLASYSGTQANWVQRQVDLKEYEGLSTVRIRFRLCTYSGDDGWYIDDVRIENTPRPHPELYTPTDVTMHGAHVCWEQYDPGIHSAGLNQDYEPQFAPFVRYEIYRDTGADVDRFDTLVFETANITETCFNDEYCILQPDYYHYRMYVVDQNGMYSIGSNVQKATYIIPQVGYPFYDDMESGTDNWEWCSAWGLAGPGHSGSLSWQDSPGGTSYKNDVNNMLTTSIDLDTATMPVLSFWHRYSLETNKDWGYVDVSTNEGSTWTTIYFVTGHHTEWKEEKIDLSPYAGDILTFRFRLQTDGENRYDGWYIDDVSIAETTASISYPFFDDMESGDANWYSSSWELVTPGHSGDYTFDDSPEGNGPPGVYAYTSLTLASTIDLSTAKNPQMSFWEHYDAFHCYVEASSNWGHTWTTLASYSGTQANWVQRQVDLKEYEGLSTVRIRFRLCTYSGDDGWYIDDVRIENTPRPHPELYTPTDVTMHGAHVCWEQYDPGIHSAGLNQDYEPQFAPFVRYEIYRDTGADVDRFDTLVFETANITETCFNDEYCILQPDYYHYRMYVVDQNGMYSIGSNVQKATYIIPQVGYPFYDDMESGTDNWEWCSAWGLAGPGHSGSLSWQDSPGGTSYKNDVNNMLTTSIDLDTATMPVLSFWHRYSLETNKDWGYVDVSTNEGSTWTTIYFVTGHHTEWKEEKIDLSPYAGDILTFRFRLQTDGENRYDGWYIDDVSIAETTASISYPFFDDMESGDANWYSSSWELVTPGHSGDYTFDDSPEGNGPPGVYAYTSLTLASTIDLSTAKNPQMSFWEHYDAFHCYVEASSNWGHTWTTLASYSGTQANWVQRQVDLKEYEGLSTVRIRFRLCTYSGDDGWYIDDVRIEGDISEATVDISVVLQGGSRPEEGWEVPITIKFFSPGADVMIDTPLEQFGLTTTKSDSTATCQCTVAPGTYDITAVSEHTLINVKRNVVIPTPSTAVDMGTLLEGNANDDSIINISDFGILAVSYMCSAGEPCYDCRADFDRNGIINISDFGLLAVNYMKMCPIDISG